MTSAACLTNRRRLVAEAKNTKVQYPGNISANTESLFSSINCNPNFTRLSYIELCKCRSIYTPQRTIIGGGGAAIGVGLPVLGGGGAGGVPAGPIFSGGAAGP